MNTDLTFIINEIGRTLKNIFEVLIKNFQFFDCLESYFYISGFHAICKYLEKTEKTRILIGISRGKQIFNLINSSVKEDKRIG